LSCFYCKLVYISAQQNNFCDEISAARNKKQNVYHM
jgi:hypothetical protein